MRISALGRRPVRGSLLLAGAALCGAAGALAYAPVGWEPILVPAVAGLTLLTRNRSAASGALLGLVAGLGFFLPQLSWARAIATEAWLALSVIEALAWLLLGAGLALVSRLRAWPLWAAALWVLVELLRSSVPFGGFSWARLAFGVTGSPMLGWAAVGGAVAVTLAVALAGQLLAYAVLALRGGRTLRTLAGVGAAAAVVLGGLAVPLPTGGRPVTVAAVQGDVPSLGVGTRGPPGAVLSNHVRATKRLADEVRAGRVPAPDLVVWPESASDVDPFRDPAAARAISQAVAAVGVPVLVGTSVYPDATTVANTGIVWDPRTGPGERYVKRHLVPFGEYVPLRPLLAGVSDLLAMVPRDNVRGTRPGVLRVGPALVGDVICYEVAFDDSVRDVVDGGADLLVVQTNNATYGETAQPEQQFAISRLRAVEHGRTLVVAATTGTSGVVAPDGTVVASTAQHEPALVVQRVALRTQRTLADVLGPWPERVLAALGVIGLALGITRRRPGHRPGTAAPDVAPVPDPHAPSRLVTTPRAPGGTA